MFKRLLVASFLIAFGLSLGSCTRCGWIWEDWIHAPKSCLDNGPHQ